MKGLLLAGGASCRMGKDKAMLVWNGIPLWQRQVSLLRNICTGGVAVAAPQCPDWLPDTVTWLKDSGNEGPLGGILAGLRWTQGSMLVLAVDMPKMNHTCLGELLAMAENHGGVVPVREDQLEPLAAVYPYAALASGEQRAHSGELALHKWVQALMSDNLVAVWKIPDEFNECFFNANTPEEWKSQACFP